MIGYFGDSYIDIADALGNPWPLILKDSLGVEAGFHARSGTSHWHAYDRFIKNYHKYDTIVFCHTSHSRWPHLPDEEEGHHFDIGYDWVTNSDFMKNINRIYSDIFTDDLLGFLCKSIYDNVNKICRENDIYLVNLIPFPLPYEYKDTEFPVIDGIDKISWSEEIIVEGRTEIFNKWLSKQHIYDVRYCHLNPKNNFRMSNMIKNLIDNKTKNKLIIAHHCEWDYRDVDFELSITDELIKRQKYLGKS